VRGRASLLDDEEARLAIGKEGNYKKLKLKPKTIIEIEIPN
jgi:hypothetical protein